MGYDLYSYDDVSFGMKEPEDKWYIISQAAEHGIALHSRDIQGTMGNFTIDGMPWREWLEDMTD